MLYLRHLDFIILYGINKLPYLVIMVLFFQLTQLVNWICYWNILGIIGPFESDSAETVLYALSGSDLPVISPRAAGATLTSYNNFFRTVPSIPQLIEVKLTELLLWEPVSVVDRHFNYMIILHGAMLCKGVFEPWTVPQMSIIIIYNSTLSILIQ